MKTRKPTRKENQDVTRQELLSAAHHCFTRYGYQGSSVDRIATKAGFSKGAFYSNFDSKASILLEILARHHAEYIEHLRAIIERATADQMSVALGEWEALRNREPEWAGLNIELLMHAKSDEKFQAQYLRYAERYRHALAELIMKRFKKARRAPPAPAEDLAAALIALADGLAFQRFLTGGTGPEITGTMLGMVSDGWLAIAAKVT
jgi:AcrR family transcriptional regulator